MQIFFCHKNIYRQKLSKSPSRIDPTCCNVKYIVLHFIWNKRVQHTFCYFLINHSNNNSFFKPNDNCDIIQHYFSSNSPHEVKVAAKYWLWVDKIKKFKNFYDFFKNFHEILWFSKKLNVKFWQKFFIFLWNFAKMSK